MNTTPGQAPGPTSAAAARRQNSGLPGDLARLEQEFLRVATAASVGAVDSDTATERIAGLWTVDAAGAVWRIDPRSRPGKLRWSKTPPGKPTVTADPSEFKHGAKAGVGLTALAPWLDTTSGGPKAPQRARQAASTSLPATHTTPSRSKTGSENEGARPSDARQDRSHADGNAGPRLAAEHDRPDSAGREHPAKLAWFDAMAWWMWAAAAAIAVGLAVTAWGIGMGRGHDTAAGPPKDRVAQVAAGLTKPGNRDLVYAQDAGAAQWYLDVGKAGGHIGAPQAGDTPTINTTFELYAPDGTPQGTTSAQWVQRGDTWILDNWPRFNPH